VYSLRPRGRIAALAATDTGRLTQLGAILATGNSAVIEADNHAGTLLADLPPQVAAHLVSVASIDEVRDLRAVLFEGDTDSLIALNRRIAAREGAIVQVQAITAAGDDYDLACLLEERSVATNTAAAGGNASLLAIGE